MGELSHEELLISTLRDRSKTIASVLAENAIPNDNLTAVALIHILTSRFRHEGLDPEGIKFNILQLLEAAMKLMGEIDSDTVETTNYPVKRVS